MYFLTIVKIEALILAKSGEDILEVQIPQKS